ncbi:hypothetical protein DES40_1379 [Litorimonas taeanensis]|uniref:Phytase-like domain-containing protein n=1 Tax=Litorimonas taeanensis TaxID=568099 RepID=A0A420WMA5_9PROT|nr:esterase-like activity of phytase family protein [Litorimonas taeanensis]RKQ72042.1 hypothetical protein DES40_1379 [Litorimonas taeanensis]
MPLRILKMLSISMTALIISTHPVVADDTAEYLDQIKQKSCAKKSDSFPFASLDITATPVALGDEAEIKATLPHNVKFLNGWHLTAPDSRFGGLSGIDRLPNGDLMAVSDQGTIFVIGLTDNAPNGRGAMTPLLDHRGQQVGRKMDSDSEGLVYHDGLVFISFERDHRVLAYDFFGCKSAARGIKILDFPRKISGKKIPNNSGAEALDISTDGHLISGFEFELEGKAPIVTIALSALANTDKLPKNSISFKPVDEPYSLVGLSKSAALLRTYDPKTGNRNIIQVDKGQTEFTLQPPLAVDNFEGITEVTTPEGQRLIYIISDDNFSGRQRTLLHVFEITDE